jgi:hypothetical protein
MSIETRVWLRSLCQHPLTNFSKWFSWFSLLQNFFILVGSESDTLTFIHSGKIRIVNFQNQDINPDTVLVFQKNFPFKTWC